MNYRQRQGLESRHDGEHHRWHSVRAEFNFALKYQDD
jgi:hypothetical protein